MCLLIIRTSFEYHLHILISFYHLMQHAVLTGFQNTFLPSSSDGFRVGINIPGVMPDIEQQGIEVSSGYATSIGIVGKEVIRKPWPYGTCSDTDFELKHLRQSVARSLGYEKGDDEEEEEDYQPFYSEQDCRSACLQGLIWQECKCLDLNSRHPFPNVDGSLFCGTLGDAVMERVLNQFKDEDLWCMRQSLLTDKCAFYHKIINDLACVKKITKMFNKEKLSGQFRCKCPPACYSYDYDLTVSQSPWPAPGFETEAAYKELDLPDHKAYWLQTFDRLATAYSQKASVQDELNISEIRLV